jgi:hypothetical protein
LNKNHHYPAIWPGIALRQPPGAAGRHQGGPFKQPLLLFFVALVHFGAFGQDTSGRYFYTHPEYGSQSTFNPLSVFLNGGYDIVQTGMFDADIFKVPYGTGAHNVWDNISHPMRQISRHGWGEFLGSEVFPVRLEVSRSQYLPNYTLHLLGGGATYRMLCEWSEAHGVPYPKLSAIAFATAYNFLNEIMENGSYAGVNVDPIADMWIFNPLGMLLFSSDRVARFMSATVHLCDWSGMPFIDPVHGKIDNASQNWAVKIPLPRLSRTHLFVYLGMSEVAGLSYTIKDDIAVSGGGGFSVGDIVEADSGGSRGRVMTIHYSWNAGLFVDKSHSLLFSLLLSNSSMYKVRANLYPLPGFHFHGLRPAFFAGLGSRDDPVFGVTANWLPVSLSVRAYH